MSMTGKSSCISIPMNATEKVIQECLKCSKSRLDFWICFLNSTKISSLVELGVYKGDFAEQILKRCDSIKRYYMIDPWRHLDDWNKPANKEDDIFEQFLSETISKTDFASDKRVILRGKTTEVIEHISDGELDFAYIDGDHTLKGITIDLIRTFPKIREGGWIGGDDFSKTIWQHATTFEPTLVFPFAVYFAEAVGARIYALANEQFLLQKTNNRSFAFVDLTKTCSDVNLRGQFHPDKVLKLKLKETFPFLFKISRPMKRFLSKLAWFQQPHRLGQQKAALVQAIRNRRNSL